MSAPDTGKVIGGVFGFECPALSNNGVSLPFAGAHDQVQYFLNFRCALKVLCDAQRPRAAWLPSYLCEALLRPFTHNQIPIHYYPVDSSLKTVNHDWIEELHPGDLVIVIHYFGFANSSFPAARVASKGALLVEDASQALFLPQQFSESACIVYSPRKFLPVPEMGVMASRSDTGTEAAMLAAPPDHWWKSAIAMMQKRRDFDLVGGNNEWFSLFQQVESQFPLGSYAPSDLSKMLLTCGTDYEHIRARRRENYFRLREKLEGYAMFSHMGENTIPLGFPVLVDPRRRDGILRRLYEKRIYPPVHWRINGIVPPEFCASHTVSNSIMTLICDQRYTLEDMDRQAWEFTRAKEMSAE
ncbi:MAG: hypothetical protein ACJ73N_09690 [Bryobacteraceae bacterium]